ncbi:MAG: chemotaxis protein CheW [Pseudobdellovibrionaceae bacterium]
MEQTDKFLNFAVGDESFGVPLLTVREVIGMPEVTPIPQAPQHVVGIMNLRGQIITIFDLRSCLKIQSKNKDTATVIICEMPFGQMGLIVDHVSSVLSANQGSLSEVPPGSKASHQEFITNIYTRDKEMILMLDVEKLVSREAKLISQVNSKVA